MLHTAPGADAHTSPRAPNKKSKKWKVSEQTREREKERERKREQ